MPSISYPRAVAAVAGVSAAVLGCGRFGDSAAARVTSVPIAKPPKTVTATLVTRRPGELAPGSNVPAADIFGQRVFTDAVHGFALASAADADYPVATADGGKTWKIDGPALHLHAAQAPLAVTFIGVGNRRTVFAWGGGQVIDSTRDGGKHWYRVLFADGEPIAVVHDFAGHLIAFVGAYSGAPTWQYVSRDGGRTWHYQATVAG